MLNSIIRNRYIFANETHLNILQGFLQFIGHLKKILFSLKFGRKPNEINILYTYRCVHFPIITNHNCLHCMGSLSVTVVVQQSMDTKDACLLLEHFWMLQNTQKFLALHMQNLLINGMKKHHY